MSPSSEATITPFQSMQARCVACEQEGRYTRLKSTLYSETKRDIDLRPTTILWSKKVSPRVDPKLFYFWQCPYCFFTADHGFFIQPFKDGNMSPTRFRKQFQKASKGNEAYTSLLKLLSVDPNQEKSVFMSGLKLNLLACYQWELVDDIVAGESISIGSYYLRMAWMLHDLRHALSKSPNVQAEAQALLHALRPCWPKLPGSESAMLEKALFYYQLALTKSAAINTVLQEVNMRLIIARIQMKLGRMTDAKRSILECKARVKHYESLIRKKQQKDSNFTAEAIEEMEVAHGKAMGLLGQVEQIYDKIEIILFDRQVGAAKTLLAPLAAKSYEQKLLLLKAAKIPDPVIAKALPPPQKKSIIKILKSS